MQPASRFYRNNIGRLFAPLQNYKIIKVSLTAGDMQNLYLY